MGAIANARDRMIATLDSFRDCAFQIQQPGRIQHRSGAVVSAGRTPGTPALEGCTHAT
jgi:hypothetical protein